MPSASDKKASSSAAAPRPMAGSMARARSASIERINAVVRALARAEEDPDPEAEHEAAGELDASATPSASPDSAQDSAQEGAGLEIDTDPQRLRAQEKQQQLRQRSRRALGGGLTALGGDAQENGHAHASTSTPTSPRSASGAADDEANDSAWEYGLTPGEKEAGRQRRRELKAAQQSSSSGLQDGGSTASGSTAGAPASSRRRAGTSGRRRGSRESGRRAAEAKFVSRRASASKSWEVPRKVFHSSIGFLVLYLYLSHHPLPKIVTGLSRFLAVVVTADVVRLNSPAFERVYESVLGFLMRESEKKQVNGVVWYLVGVITSLHFFPADIACVSIMILSWCDTSASVFGRLFGRHTPPLPSPPFASRKSLAGFLAAAVSGTLTAFAFWGTSVALRGERAEGVSWAPARPAVFGTANAPGPLGTGWAGWSYGVAGRRAWAADAGLGLAASAAASAGASVASSIGKAAAGVLGRAASSAPAMPLWLLCAGSGLVAAVSESLELGGVDDNLSLPILSATGIWGILWAWGRVATHFGW